MKTVLLLMAQYEGRSVIPIETICRDYFAPLKLHNLRRKIAAGAIPLPLVRMGDSQRSAQGIHIQDLANYIDERRAAAVKECEQLCGVRHRE